MILKEKFHIARKEHRCEFCGRKIDAGKRYKSIAGIYDGEFCAYVLHEICDKAITYALRDFNDNDEHSFNEIEDQMQMLLSDNGASIPTCHELAEAFVKLTEKD